MNYFILFVFLLGPFLMAQNYSAEQSLFDCINQGYSKKGVDLKKLIISFEETLINENILECKTGECYQKLLTKMVNNPMLDYNASKLFVPHKARFENEDSLPFNKCLENLRFKKTFSFAKIDKFKIMFDSIMRVEDSNATNFANEILSVLVENDFEQEYYKYKIFPLFNMINFTPLLDEIFPGQKVSDELLDKKIDLSNAFTICIDSINSIRTKSLKISLNQLKSLVRDYLTQNEYKSIFVIKADTAALFRNYLSVREVIINEINHLRKQYAWRNFGKDINELTKTQVSIIKSKFPEQIIIE
ncbi:hypothetical protein [Maribacter sp. 4U21]|uniref:hypothetical protein n=1 Tax=Maribacter sp. 4U21 TaxID=1889779 RepID=UPI00117D2C65|nr:hypothetical protein [Maribacter sp. 4U21]